MRPQSLVTLVCGCLLLQGCALPIPFKTVHSAVYQGKVVDAETREPVAKARVELLGTENLKDTAKSDASGEFEVGPLSCWRWLGVGWPLAEGRWCEHSYRRTAGAGSIVISRDGYEPVSVVPVNRDGIGLEFVETIALKRKGGNE
jgi:hypothetical protein